MNSPVPYVGSVAWMMSPNGCFWSVEFVAMGCEPGSEKTAYAMLFLLLGDDDALLRPVGAGQVAHPQDRNDSAILIHRTDLIHDREIGVGVDHQLKVVGVDEVHMRGRDAGVAVEQHIGV